MRMLELYKNGTIDEQLKAGVIHWRVYCKFGMYEAYSNYLLKYDKIEAIKHTADDFNVSIKTIKRAITMVES